MTVSDPTVLPAMQEVLAAMQIELGKVPAGPPMHFRIVPGLELVAALTGEVDECCQGVAWVRLAQFFPSDDFPAQQQAAQFEHEEPASIAVILEIGVVRCGGGPGTDMAPTDAQFLADTVKLTDDAAALRRVGANLALNSTRIIDHFYGPGPWDPLAAAGGCMGGSLHLSVQVAACDASQAG